MKAIVCVDSNWAIGLNNHLLFNIKEDMRKFKEITDGSTIVYGRNTLNSFPGKRPLPGRKNIVLSRNFNNVSSESLFGAKYAGYFIAGNIKPEDLPINSAEYISTIAVRKNPEVKTPNDNTMIFWVNSIYTLLDVIKIVGTNDNTIVCGGEEIYKQLLPYCDTVYVTKVNATADTYDASFPNLDEDSDWEIKDNHADTWIKSESGLEFKFVTYLRKYTDED